MTSILIYLGVHKGVGFDQYLDKFDYGLGFEANSVLAENLVNKYASNPKVEIVNAAAVSHNGNVNLNISSNSGASSSVGTFNTEWIKYQKGKITMRDTLEVPAINLYDYLLSRNIDYIDCYVSDIQGMDFEVLKTLKPYIDTKRIGQIICEVGKDEREPIYDDLPSSSFTNFSTLLSDNYKLAATGTGVLQEGVFNEVPEAWWEFDCMWKAK